MSEELRTAPIATRFNHLRDLISSQRFLNKEGLGNEVPFFICPFRPGEATAMAEMVQMLKNNLQSRGVRILEINLYDLVIELLRGRNLWAQVIQSETKVSKERLKELLQNVLDTEKYLIPAISDKMTADPFDVMFITGVGEVFPYIRSHNVLNNLQSTAKQQPTVMFFPGNYTHSPITGSSLDLFEEPKLKNDKYYRAFNIYDVEI